MGSGVLKFSSRHLWLVSPIRLHWDLLEKSEVIGLQNLRGRIEYHTLKKMTSNVMGEGLILGFFFQGEREKWATAFEHFIFKRSSKYTIWFRCAFLIWPVIPETVQTLATSNIATSNALENISLIKAVFLKFLYGTPVNLSFLKILFEWSTSNIKPVAVTLNPGVSADVNWSIVVTGVG